MQYAEPVRAHCCARVLVVNDDVRLAESVQMLLTEVGYEARVASDGEAALRTLERWPADLVLLDLMMPHLDGWGFLARRAAEPQLARAQVLVWSVAGPAELERARTLGADECLPGGSTPPDALMDTVAHLLAEARQPAI